MCCIVHCDVVDDYCIDPDDDDENEAAQAAANDEIRCVSRAFLMFQP